MTDNAGDSSDAITDALLSASRLLVAISARSIADVDDTLTFPQFRTLVILRTRGPVNLATLAGLLDVTPSTAGRMVDRLVDAGLIDRRPHPESRRELIAELSAHGRHTVDAVTATRMERRGWGRMVQCHSHHGGLVSFAPTLIPVNWRPRLMRACPG